MKNRNEIRWGILGCGDVCEVKSGPAFSKVDNSRLVAVMRRDAGKAKDFATRHDVPRYYTNSRELVDDNDVTAVYIATPPAYHEEYAIECIKAGKPVYIEKPVALNGDSCRRILEASREFRVKASVAHYRRGLPLFKKVHSLLKENAIGKPGLIILNTLQAPKEDAGESWRVKPAISGGGLFFDLAPHQLDILYWLFGKPANVRGYSLNQKNAYSAPDLTNVEAVFGGNIYLHGIWAFNVEESAALETCEIIGDRGKITFSFFRPSDILLTTSGQTKKFTFEFPENIQQPMIDEVVKFFLNDGPNPCSLEDALVTMEVMDGTRQPAENI